MRARLPAVCAFVASLLASAGCLGQKPQLGSAARSTVELAASAPTGNPFAGARMWVDPDAPARGLARKWAHDRPEDAAAMAKLAAQPSALWVGEWVGDPEVWVGRQSRKLARGGFLPVFVAYNIPKRDCGQYSKGGASAGQAYRAWIDRFAAGLGDRKAAVIVEPDALAHMTECLSAADQKERIDLIRYAVAVFASLGQTYVYLDAGHSQWVPADDMAERLRAAGVKHATGFSLNVSNYKWTDELIAYGKKVSARIGGKPFVIDTSRNGKGPPGAAAATEASWCNPRGRGLGEPPGTDTGDTAVHAFLWIKKPGESDGACNGGPKAGDWWTEIALELVRGAKF
jgi:endoglucanase